MNNKKPIDNFIEALQEHKFVEAHEILEDDWKTFKKQGLKLEAKAIQGLINGATALALYHIKKRPDGFKKVWPVYLKYKPLLTNAKINNKNRFFYACKILEEKKEELTD
ncbi:hypothetical protein AMRN_1670 [Malaciobacter marinus]|uniref:DUF309 domain-containing protein n=1 Tax=Malaciobacter marinus TaxID=505249 RepID=A0A347TLC4_9BACT|nr:DUF309 domain-containing protein [Malaciobacter marinus]AXX87402.1 hypothetical protein AMRN_1670 [Malaciobacter marinus]PHO16255.1 hypothetical protein CPH92_02845 [Malaciobacter marinus]